MPRAPSGAERVSTREGWAMDGAMCSKCGTQPPGEGGVLCPDCLNEIGANTRNFWSTAQPEQVGGESDVVDVAAAVVDEEPASPVS